MASVENIFQILMKDGGDGPQPTTRLLDEHVNSFRAAYPRARYRLYESEDARRFIQDRFGSNVARTFDSLRPFAFRADLPRYCLLYEIGGVYSDLSHQHYHPIDPLQDTDLTVFEDLGIHPPWAISNALISAKAGHPVFAETIRAICRHAAEQFYGHDPLEPTGPYLFGRILAQSADWPTIHFGRSRFLPVRWARWTRRPRIRVGKYLRCGTLVAVKEKHQHGSLAEFIGPGGNDYSHLWHRRQIWGEVTPVFEASDPVLAPGIGVCQSQSGLCIAPGHSGTRVTVSSVPIEAGDRAVCLHFEEGLPSGQCRVHLRWRSGDTTVLSHSIAMGNALNFPLAQRDSMDNAEISVRGDAAFSGRLRRIELI